MVIYLAGKYSGDTQKNIEAAKEVAAKLWDSGYYVICPHTNTAGFENICEHTTYDEFLRGCLEIINGVDALVLMPNWSESKGAKLEKAYADWMMIPTYVYPELPAINFKHEAVTEFLQKESN